MQLTGSIRFKLRLRDNYTSNNTANHIEFSYRICTLTHARRALRRRRPRARACVHARASAAHVSRFSNAALRTRKQTVK